MTIRIKTTPSGQGMYQAWCPELPGCVVWGRTQSEAKLRINDAIQGYLASLSVSLPRELARLAQAS